MKKRPNPPQAWLSLHRGDMLNTRSPKHRIDAYLGVMADQGYKVETEETAKGYRLVCIESPLSKKRPHLRVVK